MRLQIQYEWSRLALVAAIVAAVAAVYLAFPAPGIVSGFFRGLWGPAGFLLLVWFVLKPEQRAQVTGLLRLRLRRQVVTVTKSK